MHSYGADLYEDDVYHGRRETVAPYAVNCCGYIRIDDLDVALQRARDDYYLVLLLNGRGYYRFGAEYQPVGAGHVILYKPGDGQDYHYRAADHAELYWIHFTGTLAGGLLENLGFTHSDAYEVGIRARAVELFERIIQEIQLRKPYHLQHCVGSLIDLLAELARSRDALLTGRSGDMSERMEGVIRAMHAGFQQDRAIGWYAGQCGLSVYQFIRQFRKATQLSPARYVEKLRMAKARELLCDSSLGIAAIAGVVGYNDPFYFCRVFRKACGASPSRYRETVRGDGPHAVQRDRTMDTGGGSGAHAARDARIAAPGAGGANAPGGAGSPAVDYIESSADENFMDR